MLGNKTGSKIHPDVATSTSWSSDKHKADVWLVLGCKTSPVCVESECKAGTDFRLRQANSCKCRGEWKMSHWSFLSLLKVMVRLQAGGALRACCVAFSCKGGLYTCLHLSSWLPSADSKAAELDLPASSSLTQFWRVWGTWQGRRGITACRRVVWRHLERP